MPGQVRGGCGRWRGVCMVGQRVFLSRLCGGGPNLDPLAGRQEKRKKRRPASTAVLAQSSPDCRASRRV